MNIEYSPRMLSTLTDVLFLYRELKQIKTTKENSTISNPLFKIIRIRDEIKSIV